MMVRCILAIALALSAASVVTPAAAEQDCWLDGQPYPHKTRIGGMVCDDGEWSDG